MGIEHIKLEQVQAEIRPLRLVQESSSSSSYRTFRSPKSKNRAYADLAVKAVPCLLV